jgi:NADH:ubiquinone oxidoreductase subunit F (NADH-binding)
MIARGGLLGPPGAPGRTAVDPAGGAPDRPGSVVDPTGTMGGVSVGGLGDPGTVLLSGPGTGTGPEPLADHLRRWGPLPGLVGGQVLDLLGASGLDGRGGGGFPLGRKVAAALATGRDPVLVVNASESEPASAKDATLCAHRPHLVLDGAVLAAAALGVGAVTVHLHRGSGAAVDGIRRAVHERWPDRVAWTVSLGPDRYVSGEASAVAGYLDDGDARPRFSMAPLARRGPTGRPTVVANAETVAHLGIISRVGPDAWSTLGWGASPGPRLMTLAGAVDHPGRVIELTGPGTVGDVLVAGGLTAPPAAVLVGGFAGTWLAGDEAWQAPVERSALACLGAVPGCGLLGVLPHGACALVETARIVRYLAGESAGQCGSCVAGMPRLAAGMGSRGAGAIRRRGLRRLENLGDEVLGSGACGHPDGVVRLVRSTLDVFRDDVVRHLAGEPCRGADHPPVLAVPIPHPADAGPRPEEDFW